VIVRGSVTVPGDKSITHRALLVAALSEGRCELRGPLRARDTLATAAALRALGVRVGPMGPRVVVEGRGRRGLLAPGRVLDCRNSGTTARLLMGLLAGHPFTSTLTGDRSLRRRPMARVAEPLAAMGATVRTTDGHLPATVAGGPLRPLDYSSPVASAQVKTALLLAGLVAGVRVRVTEPVRSRDHAERLLRLLEAPLSSDGLTVTLDPVERLPSFGGDVPGDISSAAYLIAAAVLAERGEVRLPGVGVNPTRTGLLDALERMGAPVEQAERWLSLGEPAATLVARPAALRAVTVEAEEVPRLVDEIPLLACLAARAAGTSVFRGVGELRVKESDRLALIARNLTGLGVTAYTEGDTLWVEGTGRPLRGTVSTAGDHRLAMAFAVLNVIPSAQVEIDDMDCVAVSYPSFVVDLLSVLHDA
jgi:3-phosphoshikimate 1-carboxyvinyltransferase